MQQADVPRFDFCAVCDLEDAPEKGTRYTPEEVATHIQETHAGWALCKGCRELITQAEYEQGKGWCDLCVILCYDCMDEDKYGPPEPLDWPSLRTEAEVTNPEPEDPGPPPTYDWLMPKLYKGASKKPSAMEKIASGVQAVYDMFRFAVDHVSRRFR